MNELEKFWDRAADSYERTERRFEQGHIKIIENAKKHLKKDDIVLDYGCGPGTKTLEIAGNVKKIYGIDISARMIEAAKRKAIERGIGNVDFVQETIFTERYKGGTFDAIAALLAVNLPVFLTRAPFTGSLKGVYGIQIERNEHLL